MFKAEFQPDAIAHAAAVFPTPGFYLARLRADVIHELEQIARAARHPDAYVRQFCPARAAECYAALAAIDEAEGRPALPTLERTPE